MKMGQLQCIFLVLMANIGILMARQLVLEYFSACSREGSEPPIKVNFTHLSVHNNKLDSTGSITIAEECGKRGISAKVDLRQCPTNNTCSETTSIQVKELCNYLTGKSMFGSKFGQYFVPPMQCPAKSGTYTYNLTLNLKTIARLPMLKFRTYIKVVAVEKDIHNRDRALCCYNGIVSFKD